MNGTQLNETSRTFWQDAAERAGMVLPFVPRAAPSGEALFLKQSFISIQDRRTTEWVQKIFT